MPAQQTQFVCTRCGRAQSRWMGKCPDCGEWNSLEERRVESTTADRHRPLIATADRPAVQPLADIEPDSTLRHPTGLSEFDRVLGGGVVPGSAILIGGDPGIGKSTILLQVGSALAKSGRRTLYISSEESPGQIRLRAERLGLVTESAAESEPRAKKKGTFRAGPAGESPYLVAAQSNLDIIINLIDKQNPEIVVIDSVQMVYRPDMTSSPGSAAQLRDAAARLIWLAKQKGFALFLVGHVTKEGAIAGPKILEHLVDCVAYFEGDRYHSHRILRTIKNRYGSTDEIGIFEMSDGGLRPVEDPSKLFLQDMSTSRPGAVILAACEGTRPLLVEVQALCAQSVFGSAKRKATGVDAARVAMLLAVIERYADVVLGDQDVFVNVVGGVRIQEPAADLAIALAVVSAMTHRSLPTATVVCGELGLGAELRMVHQQHRRAAEAARVGFERILLPRPRKAATPDASGTIQTISCETLQDAVRHLA